MQNKQLLGLPGRGFVVEGNIAREGVLVYL
jgi:hypothetical protein